MYLREGRLYLTQLLRVANTEKSDRPMTVSSAPADDDSRQRGPAAGRPGKEVQRYQIKIDTDADADAEGIAGVGGGGFGRPSTRLLCVVGGQKKRGEARRGVVGAADMS